MDNYNPPFNTFDNMRNTKKFILGGILGGICGWLLGFIRFPYIEQNASFALGFVLCLIIVIILAYVRLIAKDKTNQKKIVESPILKTRLFSILIILIAIASIVCSMMLYMHNTSLKKRLADDHEILKNMSEIIETAGSGNLATLMQGILEELHAALQSPSESELNDTLVSKLASLSYSFTPYQIFEGDSISERKISPERGQLLIALLMMNIDAISFQKIKSNVSFSGANLNGANLQAADLSGADLRGAHFKEANLKGANLNGADMSDALLYATQLDSASMVSTNLKRADMRWSTCNFTDMQMADLNGAQMANAQFIHSNLYKATLQYADVSGAIFYKGNLRNADFMGTEMATTNFTEADMQFANLRIVTAQEAIWNNASLHKATVDSAWMQKIETWHLIGKEGILQNYTLVNDTADQWNNPLHRLINKN